MDWVTIIIVAIVLLVIIKISSKFRQKQQLAYIKKYHFQQSIKTKILERHPHLNAQQIHLVFRAMRDYFWMCNSGKKKIVAMPSKIVDDVWHEFILFTREYKKFCTKGIGRFLHHTPTEAMKTPTLADEGIKRAWRLACAKEGINPRSPSKLPLIFAIDSRLEIPNGFNYSLNCKDKSLPSSGSGYCAGHIGCSSGCAGDSGLANDSGGMFDGFFDSDGGGSDCGGGCGGD